MTALSATPARRSVRRHDRLRWLATALIAGGAGLIPWLVVLATSLPAATRAQNWAAAWTGLDSLETLGLLSTGILLIRRDTRYCLTAAATAALLVADAWLDITTSAPGPGRMLAIAMAACLELPVSAACAALASRGCRPRPGPPCRTAPVRDERPWYAAFIVRQRGRMEEADVASGRPAGSAADGPQALRYRVIIGEAADDEHACRIEEPSRLLRIWSLLQAMSEEMAQTALPPEAAPRLQRQLQAIRHELETTVSAPLAAELRRAAPPLDGPSSADGLRIECAVLLSWTASLAAQLLNALAATRRRVSRVRAVA